MLSYLHEFHAGGHADVLKHVLLLAILDHLVSKPKPLRYIETHAGAGGYDLRSPAARKNREYSQGIGRVWDAAAAPPPVARLADLVRHYNGEDAELTRYPGSPWLARECLRTGDSLYLFELHPTEHRTLARRFAGDTRVTVLRQDGFEACVGLVPPPERRGLVFMDPSYELEDDSRRVVDTLIKAHRRFATGMYALWYPVIERRRVGQLERALRGTGIAPMMLYELCVTRDSPGRGLTGSGMVVVNPPWKLDEQMSQALPWLAATLAGGAGTHRIVSLSAS